MSGLHGRGADEASDPVADSSLAMAHRQADEIVHRLVDVAEGLSVAFDKWDEPYVRGPSLYFVVLADADYSEYADPLGENVWPTDICRSVTNGFDPFVRATEQVAFSCDGAVVVTVDGTIQDQLVRIKSPGAAEAEHHDDYEYADWMGTKHLSAAEISTREEVLATVTLSEEDGRVSVFRDGHYSDTRRDELGGDWRADG